MLWFVFCFMCCFMFYLMFYFMFCSCFTGFMGLSLDTSREIPSVLISPQLWYLQYSNFASLSQAKMPSASAISAIRAIAIAVLFLEVEASRSFETETASELFDALENRSHQSHAGELGEPVDLDGTVAKKGWECGKPADDVPNRELVKNAKKKAQYLIYNWLKKSVCPPSLGEKEQHWVARPPSVLDQKRGKPCKSSITGILAECKKIWGWAFGCEWQQFDELKIRIRMRRDA